MYLSCFLSVFACQVWDRCQLQKQLSSHPKVSDSDVEQSAESDTVPQYDEEPKAEEDMAGPDAVKEEPVKEQDLQAQVHVQHK